MSQVEAYSTNSCVVWECLSTVCSRHSKPQKHHNAESTEPLLCVFLEPEGCWFHTYNEIVSFVLQWKVAKKNGAFTDSSAQALLGYQILGILNSTPATKGTKATEKSYQIRIPSHRKEGEQYKEMYFDQTHLQIGTDERQKAGAREERATVMLRST